MTLLRSILSARPPLANVIVFIGGAACLFTALGAWSSFAIYQVTAAQQDVPLILLIISLLPVLILIGTGFVTYWVYHLRDDAIWLSAAMATSPAWPYLVANLDPARAFVDRVTLGDIGASWIWSIGFVAVALYMNRLKSKGALKP